MCPKTEAERSQMKERSYRELVGGLNYLANATCPDIAFAASTLSRFCANPGKMYWILAKRVLRYLKGTLHYGIKYNKNHDKITAYTDSDWAGDTDDRRSGIGHYACQRSGELENKEADVCRAANNGGRVCSSRRSITRNYVYKKTSKRHRIREIRE